VAVRVQPQPLRGFDEECRQFITEQYEAKGLNLHPESSPEKIEKNADGTLTIHLKKKSGESYSIGGLDQVLMATGRKPNTAKLGLKEVTAFVYRK
jgi:glutathione reductase (NADPH)